MKAVVAVSLTALILSQFYGFLWLMINHVNEYGLVAGLSGVLVGVLMTSFIGG